METFGKVLRRGQKFGKMGGGLNPVAAFTTDMVHSMLTSYLSALGF